MTTPEGGTSEPGSTPGAGSASGSHGILEFAGVNAGYGSSRVLREMSFVVRPGEVVALLGSNGAGKTTTLRTAAGIIRPESGRVLLDGVDVSHAPAYRRAQKGLCLIPEGRGIFRSLTVRENLRLHTLSGSVAEAVDQAVEIFPALRDRMGHSAGHLSGGQQQMLALARAYVSRPRIILADEVSMGLAPVVVEQIFEALTRLAATGVAMILVEQYITRAMAMADTVLLLNRGTITYAGPPSGLDEDQILAGYLGADLGTDAATA